MLAIIALVLIAIVALTVLSFAVHVLFSPWLLLAVIGILAGVKFGPRPPPVACGTAREHQWPTMSAPMLATFYIASSP